MDQPQIKIFDADGDWFFNSLQFPFADPQGRVFQQAYFTRIRSSEWTDDQVARGVLQKCGDPLNQMEGKEADEAEKKAVADAAQALADAEAAKKTQGVAPALSTVTQAPAPIKNP